MDHPDGHRVEEVMSFPAHLARDHQARLLQDPQVLHGPEPSHRQLRLELGQRAAVALEEQSSRNRRVGSARALNTRSSSNTSGCYVTIWSHVKARASAALRTS